MKYIRSVSWLLVFGMMLLLCSCSFLGRPICPLCTMLCDYDSRYCQYCGHPLLEELGDYPYYGFYDPDGTPSAGNAGQSTTTASGDTVTTRDPAHGGDTVTTRDPIYGGDTVTTRDPSHGGDTVTTRDPAHGGDTATTTDPGQGGTTEPTVCTECLANGHAYCQGHDCGYCDGTARRTCMICSGSGTLATGGTCFGCAGSGKIACFYCNATGKEYRGLLLDPPKHTD
ncbi:MAG: hypothetical protein IJV98_06615 [Clostridia bacterium]|nr:hypothetical protein [Clostridia bacterium]